jgi:4-amino-4-deoxy-L-arabinose transferase-like glycosyltransferase
VTDSRQGEALGPRDRGWLGGIIVVAAFLRVAFYPGFFGSDEVTYVESAFKLLNGDWRVDSYVGANRYGVNLPVAAFGAAFGPSEWSAAAYALLCSIAEVALVTWFGMRVLGPRAGVLGGLLLATLPMHVHAAGRLSADPPVCLAVTASFVLFYLAERREARALYFAAGCAVGWSFWVKPVIPLFLLAFLAYPFLFRRFTWKWAWMVLGFALLVLANCALFWWLTGDPWYLYRAVAERRASGYLEEGAAAGSITDAPGFYLMYLLGKVYHTGLLGYLAAAGIVVGWSSRRAQASAGVSAFAYTVWWGLGLLAVFSLLVVSIDPLLFIPKQTNYMLLFVAPLCLLAGVALARLQGAPFWVVTAATFGSAVALAALHQASIHAFTANSKGTVRFAREHANAEVYGSTNAFRAASFESLVRPDDPPARIRSLQELFPATPAALPQVDAATARFAVIDLETVEWSSKEPIRRLSEVPTCWIKQGTLAPEGMGLGVRALRAASSIAGRLPARLEQIAHPAPAVVYRVPAEPCPDGSSGPRPSSRRP